MNEIDKINILNNSNMLTIKDLDKTISEKQTVINELVDKLDMARCENIDLNKTIQNMAEYIIKQNDKSVICKDTGCNIIDVNMNCTCKQCIINHFTQADKME